MPARQAGRCLTESVSMGLGLIQAILANVLSVQLVEPNPVPTPYAGKPSFTFADSMECDASTSSLLVNLARFEMARFVALPKQETSKRIIIL